MNSFGHVIGVNTATFTRKGNGLVFGVGMLNISSFVILDIVSFSIIVFITLQFKYSFCFLYAYHSAGTGLSSGVNFAIPIDTVVRTVPYLIVYGTPYSNRF